ncbi:protogenin, partial [Aplysia californica]|uniref:Protogenin n=1 Tax=Aplysia californica TaxID=6500 RepID=A0ABM1ADV0_APLCA
MASELLYLGILFTITFNCIYGQGFSRTKGNGVDKIKPGVALVPAAYKVYLQRRTPVLLNCSLNVTDPSLRPLSYTWFKDGEEVDVDRPKSKIQLFQNGSLYLGPGFRRRNRGRNSRKMDGLYVCKVKTTKGILIARRVHVVMSVMARNFSQEPASREAYQGGVARFTCDIKAEPPTSYEWFKDKKQLSSERFHTLSSGILQISDVQDSDTGFYL